MSVERMIQSAVVRADMAVCAAGPYIRAGIIAIAAGILAAWALLRRSNRPP